MPMKTCSTCGRSPPEVTFSSRFRRCNRCRREISDKARSLDPEIYLRRVTQLARNRAKRKGVEFTITEADVWRLWQQNEGRCALSGVIMTHHLGGQTGLKDTNASLDRINPKKGYTKGNIQLVTARVNLMKSTVDASDFNWWIRTLYEHWKGTRNATPDAPARSRKGRRRDLHE